MSRRRKSGSSTNSAPIGEVLKVYASQELLHAIDFLSWRGARLHTGVHHTRKALGRVRSVLAMGIAEFGEGGKILDRELKRIIRSLSTLRDAQSLVEVLDRLKKLHSASTLSPLLMRARRAAIQQRVKIARAALRDDVNFASRRLVLAVLAGGVHALPWEALKEKNVQVSFAQAKAKLDSAVRDAKSGERSADWHRWRRRARRFSQQCKAVGSVAGSFVEAETPDRESIEILGIAQDYVLLLGHCKGSHPFEEPDKKELQAMAKLAIKESRERVRAIAEQHSSAGAESV